MRGSARLRAGGDRRAAARWPAAGQHLLAVLVAFDRFFPVGPELDRLLVILQGLFVLLLLDLQVGQIEVGVGHARVQPDRFAVGLDGQIELALAAVDQAEVVVALDALGIELDAAAQGGDGLIELLQQVEDSPEVDVGAGAERIEPGDFLEMMGGAGHLAELEVHRGQTHVDVGGIGFQPQRHKVGLLGLLPVAGFNGLLGLQAESLDLARYHGPLLRIEAFARFHTILTNYKRTQALLTTAIGGSCSRPGEPAA